MNVRSRFATAGLILAAFVAAALPASAATISVGAVGGLANINTFPINVALERGFFKEQNLTVEIVNQASITTICSAIVSASIDFGQCTANEAIPLNRKGAKTVQFHGMWLMSNPYYVVVNPAIAGWPQLAGKTVMLSAPKDLTVYQFERMARAHGLGPDKLTYAFAGSSAARMAALKAGAVDATVLANPAAPLAEADGFRVLDSSVAYFPPRSFAGGGWVATTPWLSAHKEQAVGWIRASNKAIAWINDPANKADVLSLMTSAYKLTNPALAQKIYDAVVTGRYFNPSGCTFDSAEQGIIKMLLDMQLIPAGAYNSGDFAPNAYVEAATGRRCR